MSLYQQEGLNKMLDRVNKLQPDARRLWGKMDAAQMLNHLRLPLELGMARMELPGVFMMKIFGPLIRKIIFSDKPLKRNSPTATNFIITGSRNFNEEKAKLLTSLNEFIAMGKEDKLIPKHKYFGKMDAADWDFFQQKHFDHHLSQFGV
jgi:hypothetical protein